MRSRESEVDRQESVWSTGVGVEATCDVGSGLTCLQEMLRPQMRLVRMMSTELSACTKPWPTPDVKLSPKNMTEEDKRFVLGEVSKFGGELPIEKALMPPSSWYLTDAFCKAEAKAVFGTTWQFACRADQVATPGQYVASYVGAGEPVVVVRGEDGQVE